MAVATRRSGHAVSEETAAAARVVLGLTVAVGLLGGMIGLVGGGPLGLVLAPALVLLFAVAARHRRLAGWSGASLWAVIVPMARGEGMIGPLIMIVLCVGIAIGADRLVSFVARDFQGARGDEDATRRGWIEEV